MLTVTPKCFLTKIKTMTIQISFINLSKFHEFVFLKSKFSGKLAFSPKNFKQKGYIGHIF